ncbi:MAG TPA: hypothetical protein VG603_09895 [Chitinophagales bacterium]|nr:hypothetical protein [Chitinophagales bacterium]
MLWFIKDIYYSFPVQLFLLSLKRQQFLLLFWIFLFVIIIGKFGAGIGMPAVFLDPEYLGKVDYLSFALVGLGFGAMFVTWNIVLYILHSHRFPFMASLQFPLGMFFLNNFIIPLIFIVSYFTAIILFQTRNEYQNFYNLFFELLGFTAGFVLVILVTSAYFGITNTNVGSFLQANKKRVQRKAVRRVRFNQAMETLESNRVDYYITNRLSIRHTRTIEFYDPKLYQLVFRRHHGNAFIAFIVSFALIVACGFFIDNRFFQFPIAASVFLFLCVLMSMFGMFLYWTGGWGSTAIILFLIIANQLTKYDLFGYQSRVYGLNYKAGKEKYNLDAFKAISTDSIIESDKAYFLQIFENWKNKNTDPHDPGRKPLLCFINVSGGGLRAGMFSMAVLQNCDSIVGGNLLDKAFMISGASGGMFGATLLRELFMQKKLGMPINLHDRQYTYNVAKDLLNPIAISILSNDVLVPFHKFKIDSLTYYKDRGYIFEKYYCNNTGFRFDKTLNDYKDAEFKAQVPLMMYYTTVINDSRRFFISPQPVSFLMRPFGKNAESNGFAIDGIDFCRYFSKQNAGNLLVTSAMRMDATFPYILPNPVLPTDPPVSVMDGGLLDDNGIEPTFRFLQTFKDWINKNTRGVVIIQIRDQKKQLEPEPNEQETMFSRFVDPLGAVYSNLDNTQDFLTDQKLNYIDEELRGKLNFVLFEYTSDKEDEKAAMSMHITLRDKQDIMRSLKRVNNVNAFNRLKTLLSQ